MSEEEIARVLEYQSAENQRLLTLFSNLENLNDEEKWEIQQASISFACCDLKTYFYNMETKKYDLKQDIKKTLFYSSTIGWCFTGKIS